MSTEQTAEVGHGFVLGEAFVADAVLAGIDLGPLGLQYQELFAEALADGVITAEERERLEKAADNLGIDRMKLHQLEQAMIARHEASHRVKVVEKWEEEAPRSLSPIQVSSAGDPEKTMLLKQIERLNARIVELEAELREARANVNVEVDVTGLAETLEVVEESPEQLRARIRRDPLNPRLFENLLAVSTRSHDLETQFWASQALVALGSPSDLQKKPYERHKQTSLIAPRAGLGSREWSDALVHPEQDALTGLILGRITPAVLVGRVTQLRREKKLPPPNEEQRQDPAESTLMAVRALGWAAAVLGIGTPPIYVEPERQGGYSHLPGVPPHTVVGATVLRGKTHTQHAFLAGRHLAMYRQEHFVKTLFSSVTDLEDLFLAALLLGSPTLPIAEHLKQRVSPISKGLLPMIDPAHLDGLRADFKNFVAEGGRTNLQRWTTSVEKTACRAGLLLCADLPTALGVLAQEEGPRGPLAADLLAFSVSDQHARLRAHLGVTLSN
jgi:golgin subfamily B member 1